MRPERRRQSIWFGIVVVAAFFVGVTLAVAWLDGGWPDVPHPVDGDRAVCITCHAPDLLPASHHDRVGQDCCSCHCETTADAAEASVHDEWPPREPPLHLTFRVFQAVLLETDASAPDGLRPLREQRTYGDSPAGRGGWRAGRECDGRGRGPQRQVSGGASGAFFGPAGHGREGQWTTGGPLHTVG